MKAIDGISLGDGTRAPGAISVTGHLKPWTPQDHGQHSLGGSTTDSGRSCALPGSSGPEPGPNPSLTQTRLGKTPRVGGHGHSLPRECS